MGYDAVVEFLHRVGEEVRVLLVLGFLGVEVFDVLSHDRLTSSFMMPSYSAILKLKFLFSMSSLNTFSDPSDTFTLSASSCEFRSPIVSFWS